MRLNKTELVIEELNSVATDAPNTAVEAYVAQFAAIQFCAEMQLRLTEIATNRADAHFPKAKQLSRSACDKMLRSVKKSEIAGFLGNFSDLCKEQFNANVEDRTSNIYNKVVLARHNIAHGKSSDVTPDDVVQGLAAAEMILAAFEASFDSL